jgi:hypothetical protein
VDRHACRRNGERDASGARAGFEHGPATVLRSAAIPFDVALERRWSHSVIEVGSIRHGGSRVRLTDRA